MLTTPDHEAQRGDLRFSRRLWRMRVFGFLLAAMAVVASLQAQGATVAEQGLALAMALAWPHLAWWLARRSGDVRSAEQRNLLIDSAIGGGWIAAMHFDLLPSALLASMVTVDKLGLGGRRLLLRSIAVIIASCAVVWALAGFDFAPETSMSTMLWCLPLMFGYPLAISTALHAITQRAREQNRMLERLNRIDVVTGLPNRRHWNEVIAAEFARHLRTRRPAVLLLIDVDNFKEVNDLSGHAVGDQVLATLAKVLRASIREIDFAARPGGDEFGVLLAEADSRGGAEVAERIRRGFLEFRGPEAEAAKCTLSIGVCEVGRAFATVEDRVERTDAVMYRAKNGGRNRVEVEESWRVAGETRA